MLLGEIISPLIGGILIGISSSLMLLSLGKITGISGILANSILAPSQSNNTWRFYFIAGLILGGALLRSLFPSFFEYSFDDSYLLVIIAGLIVGFGTRLGSGCTSGHGVCGLPRLSIRSLVATLTFMFFGVMTVFLKGLL